MSPFNLSPLALVASLCGLVALAFAAYFGVKRLRRELDGPRHMQAAWAILAIILAEHAIVLAIGWNEKSLVTLMPAAIIGGGAMRLAPEITPRVMQLLALAVGGLPALALIGVHAARAYEAASREGMMICAAFGAILLLLAVTRLWMILRPAEAGPEARA